MSVITMPSTALSSETALHQLIVTLKNSMDTDMKLVAISMINEMFSTDVEHKAKVFCMKCDILPYLELIVDSVNRSSFSISDLTLVDTTLRNVWYLSQLPISALQPLLCKKFCRKILSFLDIGSHFYRFSDKVKIHLDAVCREKLLIGQSEHHSLTGHRLNSVHFHTNSKLKQIKMPEYIHACELFDTSNPECDINISEMLVSDRLAWPSLDSENEIMHKESDSETQWKQILITNFVDAQIFCAHIGTDTINSVRDIQSSLDTILNEATPIQMTADQKYVCAKGDLFGMSIYMRGHITNHYGHKVDVFAIDYGLTFDVPENQLYDVPDQVSILRYPGQAQLCCIKGLQAPPLSESAVEQAAAILCNFCRYSLPAGEILCKLGGMTCLLDLMSCPRIRIRLQVFRTLNNLACNSRTVSKLPVQQLLETLLGILNSKDEEEAILQEISIDCLGNLLYEHIACKTYFSEYGGFETFLRLMSSSEKEQSIYKKCANVLRLCFKSDDANQQQLKATNDDEETIISRKMSSPAVKTPGSRNKVTSPDSIPRSPLDRELLRMKLYQDQYSSDSEDEALLQVLPSSDETDGEAIIQKSTLSKGKGDGGRESCQMVPVDTATAYWCQQAENIYIQGTIVNIQTDAQHELRPNKTIGNVSSNKIACLACGMLNSGKESKIIFGVDPDRVVWGIKLTRDERDEFRLGVDRMMNGALNPAVMHSLFSVRYSPVARREGETTTPIPDVFIAEILLLPGRETVYTSKSVCYFRYGTSNVALSTQEVRQIVILEEEEKYEKELQRLEQELEAKHRMFRMEQKENT